MFRTPYFINILLGSSVCLAAWSHLLKRLKCCACFLHFFHCILHSLQFYLCRKKNQALNLSINIVFQHFNSPTCWVYFLPILRNSIIGVSRSYLYYYPYFLNCAIGILSWKCSLIWNFFFLNSMKLN